MSVSKFLRSRILLIVLALFSASLLGACATKVIGLQVDDDFTSSNLQNGRLGVAAVTSAVEDVNDRGATSMGNFLRTQILEERGDLNVMAPGMIRSRIGEENYTKLLNEFNSSGTLTPEIFQLLKPVADGARYIALARIENDNVTNRRSEHPVRDSDGNEDPDRSTVQAHTHREIWATFQIADLHKGAIAWSGSLKRGRTAQQSYRKRNESDLVTLVRVVKGSDKGGQDDLYPYPDAPASNDILTDLYKVFAKNLPKD